MNEKVRELWREKQRYDNHLENHVLQGREFDGIAEAILKTFMQSEATELAAEEAEAVKWAIKRLGVLRGRN